MNLFQSFISAQLRDALISQIDIIADAHHGTKLQDACVALKDFLKKYATMTPTRIGLLYAFSSFEQEAAMLVAKIYIAFIEMRSPNTKISSSDSKKIEQIMLQIVKRIPTIFYDFTAYAKKFPHFADDEDKQIARHNLIIEQYYKEFKASLATIKDPLILDCISMLETHKLLYKKGTTYDYDQLTYMLLYLMLKFDAMVNIQEVLSSAILVDNPELGQFKKPIRELAVEIWPITKREALGASKPIVNMAVEILLQGDASVMQDVLYIFTNANVSLALTLQQEMQNQLVSNTNGTSVLNLAATAKALESILMIKQPAMSQMLLKTLDATLTEHLHTIKAQGLDTMHIYGELIHLCTNPKTKSNAEVYINGLRQRMQEPVLDLSFSTPEASDSVTPTASPLRKRSRLVRQTSG